MQLWRKFYKRRGSVKKWETIAKHCFPRSTRKSLKGLKQGDNSTWLSGNGREGCGVARVISSWRVWWHGGLRGCGEDSKAGLRPGLRAPQALGPHRSKEHREGEPGVRPSTPGLCSKRRLQHPQALRPRPSRGSSTRSSAEQGLGATCPPACHHHWVPPPLALPLLPAPLLPAPEMLPLVFLLPSGLSSVLSHLLSPKPLPKNYRPHPG